MLLVLAALMLAARAWLADHPQHDPWAALDLTAPPGWATDRKLAALRTDPALCRHALLGVGIALAGPDPSGTDPCRRPDRTALPGSPLSPASPAMSCPLAAATIYWIEHTVRPRARRMLGAELDRIEHLGTYSCRRLYGGSSGPWSEHATGNAIDVAAFVLEDGRRVSVLSDWDGGEEGAFLQAVRDGACGPFGTVLSPDYNEAHRDHFHLDQEARGFGAVCR